MNNDREQRCQSCGMPLGDGFYGTEADGKRTVEYCKFCYKDGAFIEPDLKLEEMITKSVSHMTRVLQYEETKAKELANEKIPMLKRWMRESL